jgi:catechol 2,3-dioxygenase
MSTSVGALYGPGARPEAAALGSYGEPPSGYRLPAATSLGEVVLQVADLDQSVAFYERVLGLVARRNGTEAAMLLPGGGHELIVLREKRGASRAAGRGRLGLYHFAILLPDRPSLGRFVAHLASLGVRAGSADHVVSEAIYLSDPDGLGIEVYADRPRSAWMRVGRELLMGTDAIDVESLLEVSGGIPWQGMPAGTQMGHVHLHVGDLATADSFYRGVIGFDRVVWRYPGALFLGAGGYHHHLGTNTWSGPQATAPGADEAHLLEWVIELPTSGDVAACTAHLTTAGLAWSGGGPGAVVLRDPWGTPLRIRLQR